MRKIITTMIRPKMEYAETVWSPYKKKTCKLTEKDTKDGNEDSPRTGRITI